MPQIVHFILIYIFFNFLQFSNPQKKHVKIRQLHDNVLLVMTIFQPPRSYTVTMNGMEDTEDGAVWLVVRGNGASVETEDNPGKKDRKTVIVK